jgi:transcriptional regulator with XRE-family HTH domain
MVDIPLRLLCQSPQNMQLRLNSGMSRALDTLAARMKFARERANLTQKDLAELSGMRQPDISKIELGGIQKTTGIARLAMALQVRPEWLELGNGDMAAQRPDSRLTTGEPEIAYGLPLFSRASDPDLAHAVSQRQQIVTPRTIVWEDLKLESIEGQFLMAVKGDALMPAYPPGQMAIWQAGDADAANPGQAVLVHVPDRGFELRFLERRGSTWAGVSQRAGFGELQPERDQARVVARLRYLDLG